MRDKLTGRQGCRDLVECSWAVWAGLRFFSTGPGEGVKKGQKREGSKTQAESKGKKPQKPKTELGKGLPKKEETGPEGYGKREGKKGKVLASHSLLGVALPMSTPVWKGLCLVYGVGFSSAKKICHERGIMRTTRCGERHAEQVNALTERLEKDYMTGSDRRRKESQRRGRYIGMNTTKAMRLRLGLPVRGQKTETNANTARKLNVGRAMRASSGG